MCINIKKELEYTLGPCSVKYPSTRNTLWHPPNILSFSINITFFF